MRRWICVLALLAVPLLAFAGSFTSQKSVGTTAVEVGERPGASRVSQTVKAHDANTGKVYCDHNSGVSTGSGLELGATQAYTWDEPGSAGDKLYCIGSAASQTVSTEETVQ